MGSLMFGVSTLPPDIAIRPFLPVRYVSGYSSILLLKYMACTLAVGGSTLGMSHVALVHFAFKTHVEFRMHVRLELEVLSRNDLSTLTSFLEKIVPFHDRHLYTFDANARGRRHWRREVLGDMEPGTSSDNAVGTC
jgi:hypothetical protein